MTENEKKDYQKFYVNKPEGFSPEYNKYIIDKTIRENDKRRADEKKLLDEALRERTSAITDYLVHLGSGKSTPVEKYFGEKELTRLHGEDVLKKIRSKYRGVETLIK